MAFEKILVIADRPEDPVELAIDDALRLAAPDADILVCSFLHDPLVDNLEYYDENEAADLKSALIERRRRWLTDEIANHDAQGRNIHGEVVWRALLSDWIIEICDKHPYDLVVKTGHRSEQLWYTPTDWQLLRECHTPLYIGSRKRWRARANVLATVDIGSRKSWQQDLNEKVMAYARRASDRLEANLHIAYVVPVSHFMLDLEAFDKADYLNRYERRHAADMRALAGRYGVAADNIHIRVGPPAREIPSVANEIKAELVVMGSGTRHGLVGRFLGGTAEHVLSVLRTDILAIRHA